MKTQNVETNNAVAEEALLMDTSLKSDLKTSIMVVSVLTNLFILVAFLVVRSTSGYDAQVMSFLFSR